jgi:hypothetical protein
MWRMRGRSWGGLIGTHLCGEYVREAGSFWATALGLIWDFTSCIEIRDEGCTEYG